MNNEYVLSERSESGLRELKRKYERLILKVCLGVLNSREDAEECANDALLAVWESIERDYPENLTAYVCKIARRKALNRLRYNTAPMRSSELLTELDECLPSTQYSPESAFENAELSAALNDWLGTLSEKQRALFMRRYFFSESIKDAARFCRMSVTAATSALSRLRGSLKKYLSERGFDYEN
ncbi:MAG: sigma-70 family RNA polymerase sigma factor [Ruminococcaceae bacterium]|nr:sigma-70 family RNA polymerase sigma factor [Oscillospiraceae bacterium]